MINIIFWVAFGALTGWIASLLSGLDDSSEIMTDIVFGIFGAIAGGLIIRLLSGQVYTGLNSGGLTGAIAGAVALLSVRQAMLKITHHNNH